MDESTRGRIRHVFLSPRPHWALMTAAGDLGMTLTELKREIADGAIVAVSTGVGERLAREEMLAVAMRVWEQGVIEAALGDDAGRVLPEAIRLVELRARVPRYQREMLRYLARRDGTSVDHVLTRELEDVASANAEELAGAVPDSRRRWRGRSASGPLRSGKWSRFRTRSLTVRVWNGTLATNLAAPVTNLAGGWTKSSGSWTKSSSAVTESARVITNS